MRVTDSFLLLHTHVVNNAAVCLELTDNELAERAPFKNTYTHTYASLYVLHKHNIQHKCVSPYDVKIHTHERSTSHLHYMCEFANVAHINFLAAAK